MKTLLRALIAGSFLLSSCGRLSAQHLALRAPVPVADTLRNTTYEASGIRVVQRYSTSSDIVVANLYLLGGVRQVTAENVGIEPLLLELTERGTHTYAKERLRRQMARL